MTGYLKGKPISQVDMLLIDGKEYTEAQVKDLLKRFSHEIVKGRE